MSRLKIPVEYQLGMVNQVQVHAAIDLTFATVLRSVLRQDPNVIMLGEIRDAETAQGRGGSVADGSPGAFDAAYE